MWLVGEPAKKDGGFWIDAEIVGANRYMSTKFMIEPTTRVEKTKSSSLSPKLGREAMSPRTQALTPTISSMRTLNGNWGSAKTLDRHPLMKALIGLKPSIDTGLLGSSESSPPPLFPPPPRRPRLLPPVMSPPPPAAAAA
ncbi:nuclear fusion defective 6 [Striga asiatica]|uniref:Nuclear fusion defective 6 n=1 Tax=Striga asiatica TaxID=4170 RepID=A0A5A7RI56_STRAF|nr:nuclear fusion defective 6 [Striga asiatica]